MEPTFGEQLKTDKSYSDVKLNTFTTRLTAHGEVMVKMASGEVHNIHLGDRGSVEEGLISYKANDGSRHNIFTDQIESMWTHLGYPEG
jgi:hypothetical protein